MAQNKRAYAKRLMVHYFKVVWPTEKYPWHSDNQAEIEDLVDAIIDAAGQEMSRKEKEG